MRKYMVTLVIATALAACGDDGAKKNNGTTNNNGTIPNNGTTANKGTTANNGTTAACMCPLPDSMSLCEGTVWVESSCDRDNDCKMETVRTECLDSGMGCDIDQGGCVDLCANVSCDTPAPKCEGDVAVTTPGMSMCNPADGVCEDPAEVRVDCAATQQACDAGICVDTCQANDPCDAPADMCNGTVLTSYSGPGSCDTVARQCTYDMVKITTDCDTAKQVCQTDKCVDLCENETCDAPAAFCTGDVATTYSGAGACNYLDGTCSFAAVEQTQDCTLAGHTCSNGACVSATPVAPVVGDFVISEFLPDPGAVPDRDGEWLEIKNLTGKTLILDGLILKDDGINSHVITGAPNLAPNAYYILGRNADISVNGGVTVDYVYGPDMTLSNTADEIIFEDSAGTIFDRVDYTSAWPTPRGVAVQMGSDHDLATDDNNDVQFWCEAFSSFGAGDLGTPGAANDSCAPKPVETFTIYEIQDTSAARHPSVNSLVSVNNVIVSALNGEHMFVQEVAGGAFSGIYVNVNSIDVTSLSVGSPISLEGLYTENATNSMITLSSFTSTGMAMPVIPEILDAPTLVTPSEAEKWEGVLVQINEAGVTAANARFSEFTIDGSLNVDDLLFSYTNPLPCAFYTKVAGPLYFSFRRFKIVPRDAADLILSPDVASDQRGNAMVSVNIQNFQFTPEMLCVDGGADIRFTNLDVDGHVPVSRNPTEIAPNNIDPTNVFLTNILTQGQSGVVTMSSSAATEHYRCRPHANMEGVVIVVEP